MPALRPASAHVFPEHRWSARRTVAALIGLWMAVPAAPVGCSRAPAPAPAVDPELGGSPKHVELYVENNHQTTVRLFVRRGGHSTRIGEINPATQQTFNLLPQVIGVTGEIQLVATPIASPVSHRSGTLVVKPGQQIVWTIEQRLATSVAFVR